MKLEDLRLLVTEASWFEHLGEPGNTDDFEWINTLDAWSGKQTDNFRLETIADQMAWLPSSRDQSDPFHGRELEKRVDELGKAAEFRRASLDIYKTTLSRLRKFDGHILLLAGPHDFTEAARGAALFAVRRASYEVLIGKPAFWCSMLTIYHAGHWPCGIMPTNKIVVL